MAVFKKKKPQNDESRYMASQWKLMWIKLKKHKLAKFSMIVLAVLYFGALFADFLAPYGLEDFTGLYKDTAPTTIHWTAASPAPTSTSSRRSTIKRPTPLSPPRIRPKNTM